MGFQFILHCGWAILLVEGTILAVRSFRVVPFVQSALRGIAVFGTCEGDDARQRALITAGIESLKAGVASLLVVLVIGTLFALPLAILSSAQDDKNYVAWVSGLAFCWAAMRNFVLRLRLKNNAR